MSEANYKGQVRQEGPWSGVVDDRLRFKCGGAATLVVFVFV